MKIAFSWDDGALEDQRLFELHEKYEIPGMFFVPTRNREGRDVLTPQMMREAESKYIEFGGHTENHTYLTDIPVGAVESEVLSNKVYLENVLGHEVDDFCLPGGKYTTEILEIVYRHYKTVRSADTMNFTYGGGVLKPTIHFYPRGNKSLIGNAVRNQSYSQMMYIAMHHKENYFDLIRKLIQNECEKKDSVIIVWGHSWELEQFSLWNELENLMKMNCVRDNTVKYRNMFTTMGV